MAVKPNPNGSTAQEVSRSRVLRKCRMRAAAIFGANTALAVLDGGNAGASRHFRPATVKPPGRFAGPRQID
jgi:hypothetical protein